MMACPGACFSGGGQPKINNTKPKEVLENMNKIASTLSR
jgi:iron only hydrogenase large subunit-like protein